MNTNEPNLIAYRAGDLVIAHLRTREPLSKSVDIQLDVDRAIIPKPYLAVALANKLDYFIVARCNATTQDRRVVLSVIDGVSNEAIARSPRKNPASFSEFPLSSYDEADQSRLRNGLLNKAPTVLSPLTPETIGELESALRAEMPAAIAPDAIAVPTEGPTSKPPIVAGFLERASGGLVLGWVWNEVEPETHLPVELWIDGQMAWAGIADKPRVDLAEAGIGEGDHAFQFEIPTQYFDGEPHVITVKEARTGSTIGELEYQRDTTLRSHIDGIHGLAVAGWVAREYPSIVGDEILVWENGELIAQGRADQPSDIPYGARFHIPLPISLFDGRIHHFLLRNEHDEFLGEFAAPIPYVLTPEDALLRYGGSRLRGALMTNAARRYECLRDQFQRLGNDASIDPATRKRLAQIFDAHEQVLRGFQHTGKEVRNRPTLNFSQPDNPDVSVVIPVHNKFEVTYNCLASLVVSSNAASYEVILVDDGSQDETVTIADHVIGITVLRNETAQGFVRSCNRGGEAARGRFVVMLNNDVEVGPSWVDELLRIFREHDRVGMAGAKLLYPNGTLQEAGGIVWNTGDPWNYGRGANPFDPRFNYVRDVDYLSGACIMLPKALWDDLSGFDLMFAPAYFEDTDLAFRVRAKGFRTVYAPFCEIVHFEGISSGTSTSSGTKRYQEINRPKFKKRHAQACFYNGVVGADVELNKDRNIRYRALVIDTSTPRPDQDAGSYAAIQEMRLLQALGCKLTFIPENAAYLGEYTERLQRMGVECAYAPFTLSPIELLQQRGHEFNLIYITRYSVAEKFIDAIREFAPQARIVFNNADLHFLRELRLAIAKRSEELMSDAIRTRDAELSVMRRVDLTLSYNEVEHAVILSHNLSSTKVAKCPWVVELPEQVPGFAERRDIAFLGSYGHPPNTEAVEAFVMEVMPLLRKRLPGVRFLVYGSNPPKRFDDLETDDVIIKGWVKDVAEVYDTCRVFVSPLKTGAGIKGKVLGALAHGVPSVLSPISAEGTGLRKDVDALIADKPDDWVKAIAELYEDESRWRTCSEAARKFTANEYSFEQGRILMAEALAMVDIF